MKNYSLQTFSPQIFHWLNITTEILPKPLSSCPPPQLRLADGDLGGGSGSGGKKEDAAVDLNIEEWSIGKMPTWCTVLVEEQADAIMSLYIVEERVHFSHRQPLRRRPHPRCAGQRLSGIAGSPAYVAPEVLSGNYSEKIDIWGAGVLLHGLLVGVLPFQGGSLEAVFEAIKTAELDFRSGLWGSVSELARDLISKMLTRDVSSRMTADEVLRHPWIVFYTECPSRAIPCKLRVTNSSLTPRIQWERIRADCDSSCSDTSSHRSEDQDECGFVDVLAAAISRVRISEPKRTRICGPAIPIQQECSSNMKANLCTAF